MQIVSDGLEMTKFVLWEKYYQFVVWIKPVSEKG